MLNSYHCDDNNHKSMCHLFTHPCIFISICRAATGKQEHVNTAVYFSSSRWSAAARTGTIILFTRCLWDGLPGRYLNLASGVGKFHESRKKKTRHDHIDLHFGGKATKGYCNCNSSFGQNRSATRTRAKQPVTADLLWPSLYDMSIWWEQERLMRCMCTMAEGAKHDCTKHFY